MRGSLYSGSSEPQPAYTHQSGFQPFVRVRHVAAPGLQQTCGPIESHSYHLDSAARQGLICGEACFARSGNLQRTLVPLRQRLSYSRTARSPMAVGPTAMPPPLGGTGRSHKWDGRRQPCIGDPTDAAFGCLCSTAQSGISFILLSSRGAPMTYALWKGDIPGTADATPAQAGPTQPPTNSIEGARE